MVLSVKFCKIDPHYPYIGRLLQYFVTFLTIHVGVTLFDHHSPQHSPFLFHKMPKILKYRYFLKFLIKYLKNHLKFEKI